MGRRSWRGEKEGLNQAFPDPLPSVLCLLHFLQKQKAEGRPDNEAVSKHLGMNSPSLINPTPSTHFASWLCNSLDMQLQHQCPFLSFAPPLTSFLPIHVPAHLFLLSPLGLSLHQLTHCHQNHSGWHLKKMHFYFLTALTTCTIPCMCLSTPSQQPPIFLPSHKLLVG